MATTKKTRIITVVNHKGGVGKTMTAANLGAALAKMGKTVLLVDADGQCNLTMQSVEEVTVPTLSDYLNNDDIEVNPQQVSKKLFLIPGSTALDADSHNIELSIEEDAGATKYMSEWLEKVKGEYDYVIIDSAPGSGAMLVNVIVAADELIIPIADKFQFFHFALIGCKIVLESQINIYVFTLLLDGRKSDVDVTEIFPRESLSSTAPRIETRIAIKLWAVEKHK